MKRKEYYEYPKRVCYSLHHCEVCEKPILCGEKYFDGGYGRRCHIDCGPPKKPRVFGGLVSETRTDKSQ